MTVDDKILERKTLFGGGFYLDFRVWSKNVAALRYDIHTPVAVGGYVEKNVLRFCESDFDVGVAFNGEGIATFVVDSERRSVCDYAFNRQVAARGNIRINVSGFALLIALGFFWCRHVGLHRLIAGQVACHVHRIIFRLVTRAQPQGESENQDKHEYNAFEPFVHI